MATCARCQQPFNGTPWDYRTSDGERVHADCDQAPPPKANLGPADPGTSPLPGGGKRSASGYLEPTAEYHTIGQCLNCNGDVSLFGDREFVDGRYRHIDCDRYRDSVCNQAANQLGRPPAKAAVKHGTPMPARYRGRCCCCDAPIVVGDPIVYANPDWAHQRCGQQQRRTPLDLW